MAPFHDLVSAFAQDVDDEALCVLFRRRSTTAGVRRIPVGRLLLALYGADTPANHCASDAICTGLQLTNFWQDVAIDWRKGRVYMPLEDLAALRRDEAQIAAQRVDDRWRALMAFEVARARALLARRAAAGPRAAVAAAVSRSARVIAGGTRILDRIDAVGGDVFRHRPVLRAADWIAVALPCARPIRDD